MSANIFTVKRSEIEGRLDPIYYIRKNELVGYKHLKLEKIGKHFFVKDGDHDKLPDDAVSDENNGFRYLRAQDLKENKIISEKPIYVTKKYFESVRRCHIYPNDLLFSIMASVGATAVVPKNFSICTANRAVGILRAKNESVFLPEYVQVVLNTELGIKLLELQKRGGIQQRVNLDDISNLELPVFDFEKQRKIIDFYNSSLSQKQQKQEQAKKLLASIDSYLLSELGITLSQKDNSLSKRIFVTKFSEVSGGRLDPKFYRYDYNDLIMAIKKSDNSKLKNIVLFSNEIWNQESDFTDVFPYLEISEINLDYGEIDSISLLNKKDAPSRARMILRMGDIAISLTRPMRGAITIVDNREYEFIIGSTGFAVIRRIDEARISKNYLHAVLKSPIVLNQFDQRSSGGNYPAITQYDLGEVLIPLPPLPKQKEIAGHIRSIRAQAKQLQSEAEQIMQDAKHQVEEMILGE